MKPATTRYRHITLVASSVALVAVGIVVTLLGLELGVRLIVRHYLNPFEPDATLAFRLKANFAGRYPWTPVRTDEDGFRTPAVDAPSSRRAILFVGDSVTFGFSVLAEEAYPYRFGERIGRPGDVVNAAVPGYNLEQVIGTIRRVVASDKKPELIVYGLCLNDIGGARETTRYEDIDPHGSRARRGGLLSSSLLVTVLERRVQRLWARIVPAPVYYDKESLLRDLSSPSQTALASFGRQWSELENLQRTIAIPIVVVVLPYQQQVEQHPEWQAPQEYLRDKCAMSPLRCLDAWAMFREHRDRGLYAGSSSMHLSPDGNRLLADWLAESLRGLDALSPSRRSPA